LGYFLFSVTNGLFVIKRQFKFIFQDNRFLFLLLGVLLLVGLVVLGQQQTGDSVLFFAAARSDLLNQFFRWTNLLGELPSFVILGLILFTKGYKYVAGIPLVAVVVSIITQILKKLFAHPRPALFFESNGLSQKVIPVDGEILNMGLNSFPSGHTAAAFALFIYAALIYRGNRVVTISCVLLATLGGISRIYLFQHFLKDVVFGATLGILSAITCYLLIERWQVKWGHQTLF
jgi:membrane-associated phospholipid phosphatase